MPQEWTFANDADLYQEVILGRWPLLRAQAAAQGRALVWAATTGEMAARASNRWRDLDWSNPAPEFVTWGDLARVAAQRPGALKGVTIVGDVDFEERNPVRQMLSGDGIVRHDAVVKFVWKLAAEPGRDLIFVHRANVEPGFDYRAILAGAAKGEKPPPTAQETYDREQVIASIRVLGTLYLAWIAWRLFDGATLEGWDLVIAVSALFVTIGGYVAKLPKKAK